MMVRLWDVLTAALCMMGATATPPPLSKCAAGTAIYNETGCTTAGHYAQTTATSPADCCNQCTTSANAKCVAWTFHPPHTCELGSVGKLLTPVSNATCGCRFQGCTSPPAKCDPIYRPLKPAVVPLPAGKTRPHLVSMLIDDLGLDDTSLNGNTDITFTPKMQALVESGIRLDRHHTYYWCSPTRRSFLSGRYPTHITGVQAPQCSNYLPLQFTILSEKLKAADYESVFIGKGHLGYHTVDHLPVNRGFAYHVGYLEGGESYKWGGAGGAPGAFDPAQVKHHDMWHSHAPATGLVDQINYSTNFYTAQAVERIRERNTSKPFWLHLTYQAVHGGNWREDVPPQDSIPAGSLYPHFQAGNYGSVTHALDDGIGNITAEMKAQGMWGTTLFLLTSDNGGDCGLPTQPAVPGHHGVQGEPGSASNYPLLGRKCTAFEGGTRVAAFLAGGMIPPSRRGTTSDQLMYITDWYPTFCNLAGVDPTDDWVDPVTKATHPIDGVDMWDAIFQGPDGVTSPVREWLPTSERSLLWNDGKGHMWKLVTGGRWASNNTIDDSGEYKSNRFHRNGTQYMDPFNPCLPNELSSVSGTVRHGSLTVPPSCVVCSKAAPCVFDVLADPRETSNVARGNPDLVGQMKAKLATFNDPYIPSQLTPENLACYNCTASNSQGIGKWGNFLGPCCTAL